MPKYDFRCSICSTVQEDIVEIGVETIICPNCKETTMKRLFSPPTHIAPDLKPYFDENISDTGEWVTSKQHRRELMKKNKLVEIG